MSVIKHWFCKSKNYVNRVVVTLNDTMYSTYILTKFGSAILLILNQFNVFKINAIVIIFIIQKYFDKKLYKT